MMKKFFICSLAFLISACTQGSIYSQFDQECHTGKRPCAACKQEKRPCQQIARKQKAMPIKMVAQTPVYQPRRQAPVIVTRQAPIAAQTIDVKTPTSNCTGCQPIIRQTREPVEIIYKKVTYTTVYEPKTTSTITYEKESLADKKIIYQPQTTEVAVKSQKKQNLSEVIENTLSSEPDALLVEEIK